MKAFIAVLACACVLALLPAGASAARYERIARTPVATSASATARVAVSSGSLRSALAKLMRGAGRRSGAWVADVPSTGGQVKLFSKRVGKRRKLASNTKLFTTSTALVKFGPEGRLATTAWNTGTLLAGQMSGDLVLRGGGDPTLSSSGLATLASRVKAAGVTSITGHVVYDESFFDGQGAVPVTGVSGSIGGSLSGLIYPGGAKKAAQDFVADLKQRGITVSSSVRSGTLPKLTSTLLADFGSPTIADLIEDTNVPSNNFFAETLVKDIGATFGAGGSTVAGINVIKGFARSRGAQLKAENGSGLTVKNRASPASVGRLLVSMLKDPPEVASAWTDSLAVAGQTGTLARRMRGTAAAGRCRGKTGTINGVSALSGYCLGSGHTTAFSFLMSRISDARAHLLQDKMTAIVARYRP